MPLGDPSFPTRFGNGQSADDRNLFLKVFGGEVLAAFDLATKFLDKHEVRTITAGKSVQFPKTWKATAEYHTPGTELLGEEIETTEIVVTVDQILVSHVDIADIDEMISHFEVRSKFTKELGRALGRVYDKNVARQILLAARTAADGPFPGGSVITDATLTNTGSANGADWVDAIREARRTLFGKDVPDDMPLFCAVNENVFDAIKYAKDAGGHYLVINRDFGSQASVESHEETLRIDGVTIFRTRNLPTANESANTSVYSKYRANYSTTTGVLWNPMAVATVKLMDPNIEMARDARRLVDFVNAKMLVGHGTLRPECAIEFRTAAPV